MEFWGVEAKPGQTLNCDPGEDKYIHLSQLAIGENAKDNERVSVYVHFEGKKIMLGTFTHGTCDQIGLDLVFEKKFQISHTSKGAAVFCSGYTTFIQDEDDGVDSEDEEEMMEAAFPTKENGGKVVPTASKTDSKEAKQEANEVKQAVTKPGKPDKGSNGKPQVAKIPSKKADEDEEDSDDEDEDEDEDDDDDEDSEEDTAMEAASESDEDDDDSDSDEEEEETPKVKDGKKRLAPNSATKTPGTDKKAKLVTPEGQKKEISADIETSKRVIHASKRQKVDVKKNVHVATPHPGAKQGGKKGKVTPGTSKPQTPAKETPKSNATPGSGKKLLQFTCTTCPRTFNSESGLSSHTAAKHGGK